MKLTENYGLKKPDGTDIVNIEDLNYNADIVDTKLKELNTEKAPNSVVSATVNGLMTKEDKVKLNGIATGANAYVHPSTHPATLITEDATHRFVTDTEKSTWNGKAASNHNHDSSYASKGEFDSMKEQIVQNKPIVITDDYPVGGFMWFTVDSVPTGWLVCNGQGVTIADYPDLFNVIGYKHGGEGSWFRVPDLVTNNRFIRASAGVEIGVKQDEDYKAQSNMFLNYLNENVDKEASINQKNMYSISGESGTETIPVNISFLPCIKSKQLSKGMTTVAQEWSNFKENGGSINGDLSVTSSVISPVISAKTADPNGWPSLRVGNPDTVFTFTVNPSAKNFVVQSNMTGTYADHFTFAKDSFYPVTTIKDLGTTGSPWSNLWLGNFNISSNGYSKLSNGLIIQWGLVYSRPGNAIASIVYPISFPNKTLSLSITPQAYDGYEEYVVQAGGAGNNSFEYKSYANSKGSFFWIAIGC